MSTEIRRWPTQTRVVTILFVDLSGSSAHLNTTDAETHLAAVQGFVSIVRQNVEKRGGHVIQYLGDGAMCFFGDDRGSEDDASRAVSAALDLLAAWDQVPVGKTMRARCGVASGVIYFSSGDLSATVPATGPAINLASRLQDLAEDDQVLLCSRTHALIRGGISCRLAGHFPIHGFSRREPVFIAAARGEIRLPPTFGRKDKWPIVGRDEIIDAVAPIWRSVLAGRGQGCLFHGGAGVGKSRLVRELVHGFGTGNIISWQCVADQKTTPFFPIRSYLEWVAAVPGAAPEPQRRAAISDLLGAHWNLEAEARDNVLDSLFRSAPRQDGSTESSAASRRKEAIHTLVDQIVAMAHSRSGLVVAIEDWHWADPSLRDLVQVLLQRIENEPVLILLTSREAETGLGQANLTAFRVAPVNRDECRSIIAGIAGKDRLDPQSIDAIASMSAGFPLFLEELTAQAIANDGEDFSPSLPLTLATILQTRFDRLSEPCRQFLRMAAVQGQYFAPLVVARALGMSLEDWPAFVQQLRETDMVEIDEVPDAPQGCFSHALLQETIIHISAPPEIRSFNLMLAKLYGSGETQAEPQVIAQHYARARRPEMAIPEYLRAAGQQLMHGALVEAQAHLRKAESLLPELADDGLRREREREICALLGPTHMITGGPGSREERFFGRWYRSAHLRPPIRLPTMPYITMRADRDWQQEYELARAVRPTEHGGLGWQRPSHPDLFRPSLSRALGLLVTGRTEKRWIVRSSDGKSIIGALREETSFGGLDRLEMLVHPTYSGQLEEPLINFALRLAEDSFRAVSMEHPMDDTAAVQVLEKYDFERRYTTVSMRIDL